MKLLLLLFLMMSCVHRSGVDKRYDCVVELVKEGVDASKAASACKETFQNGYIGRAR